MKILKIELQNLNSLKCELPIVIDFENERFQDVGLFAITGPTGAGKTTLLDAITIALYRKVPRFEKSNSNAKLEDVVSYGAATAMARVTFEAKENKYEAQWNIRMRSNTGKLLGKPVETVRLKNLSTEKILAETKSVCDEKIIDITQLNYEQFLRSVLLAQGEFAAFLTAKNSEKGLLLQQIAGDEVYRKIGETLKNKIADERKQLELIKSKINTDDLLNADEMKQLKDEEIQLAQNLIVLEKNFKTIVEELKLYEQKMKLEQQKDEIQEAKLQLEIEVKNNATVFELLAKNEAAEPIKPILSEVIQLENSIEKKNKRISEIIIELTDFELKVVEASETELRHKAKVAEHEQLIKEWQPKLETIIAYDVNINTHKKAFNEKKNTKDEIIKTENKIKESIENKTEELKLFDLNLNNLSIYIEQNQHIALIEKYQNNWNTQLTLRKSNADRMAILYYDMRQIGINIEANKEKIDAIEQSKIGETNRLDLQKTEIEKLSKQISHTNLEKLVSENNKLIVKKEKLRELIQLSSMYFDFVEIIKISNEQKNTILIKLDELNENLKQLEPEIFKTTQSVNDAKELYEKECYIVSLETERKKLKLGEPCALCGSTNHPLVATYTELEITLSKRKLDDRLLLLEKINEDKKNIELEQAKNNANLTNLKLQIEKTTNDAKTIKLKFESFTTTFKIENKTECIISYQQIEKEQIDLSKRIVESQEQQLTKNKRDEELKAIECSINSIQLQLTQLDTLNKGLIQTNLKNNTEYKLLQLTNVDIERNIVAQLADCELQMPDSEETNIFLLHIENSVKSYNENAKRLTEIESKIKQLRIQLENFIEQLHLKINDILQVEKQLTTLEDEIMTLINSRIAILPLEINTDTKRVELQNANNALRQAETKATNELNKLKQMQIALVGEMKSIEKEQIQNNFNLKSSESLLDIQVLKSIFNNRLQVLEAMLTDEIKQEYLKIKNEIDNKTISIISLEKKVIDELIKLGKEVKSEKNYAELKEKIKLITEQKNQFIGRMGEITERYRKDAHIKERNSEIIGKIITQENICRKWATLMTILGGSQDAFNTYVQRLTLKSLIDLANLHLFKLNQRYSLQLNQQYKEREELDFKLIDHYQANQSRLVDTSSGGEKFLISLSLALGLSDLASHNVSIGSLFIDEGFGTLDSNTLETVISTLETLKAQGKTIGIISHVDSLKERITVQIQVLKRNNGVSIVELS